MRSPLRFRLFGFPVQADASALIILALLVLMQQGSLYGTPRGLVVGLALFSSILVHELGHALVARSMALGPVDIRLHGFGGLTRFAVRPTNRQGVVVSLAGPFAGLALGFLALAAQLWLPLPSVESVATGLPSGIPPYSAFFWDDLLGSLIWINLFWSVFNLLPIYPLDGGQVLWHALSLRLGATRARQITRRISVGLALVIGLFALVQGRIFLALICFFILRQNQR
jgi:Zn-dependent protease